MANEKLNVRFPASVGNSSNCICSACHGMGIVIMLKLPKTLYADGLDLTTEYNNYWLCNDCRKKLVNSLIWGDIDGKYANPRCRNAYIADHLIANGVTVQQESDGDLISRKALLATVQTERNQSVLGKTAANKLVKYINAAPAVGNSSPTTTMPDGKPQTNADRIRTMSDEELADLLARREFSCMPFCKHCESCTHNTFSYPFCVEGIEKWLQQPAEVK